MSHFVTKDYMKRRVFVINPDYIGDEATLKLIKNATIPILIDRTLKVSLDIRKVKVYGS